MENKLIKILRETNLTGISEKHLGRISKKYNTPEKEIIHEWRNYLIEQEIYNKYKT